MSKYTYGRIPPTRRLARNFASHPVMAHAAIVGDTSGAVDHGASSPFIFDQGQVGSCEAHAVARAIFQALTLKGGTPFIPSPDDLYRIFREMMRAGGESTGPLTDTGTDPFYIPLALSQWGVRAIAPGWEALGTDCTTGTIGRESVLAELLNDAQSLIVGVYEITSTGSQRVADVEAALKAGLPVNLGFNVDSAFENWTPDKPPCGPPNPADILGGHGVMIDGYDAAGNLVVVSSWGEGFANAGRILCSPAWLEDAGVNGIYVFDIAAKALS